MIAGWEEKRLDELGAIGRGKSRHRPRNAQHLYGGDYPFIQTGDIQNAEFRILNYKNTYSEDGLAQSKLWKKNTLCISIVGANTAETAILGFDACFPDSVIGFNAFSDKSDNYFMKYYLDIMKLQMKKISEGAARENLSMEKLLSIKMTIPPLPTQKKIAGILSAYDNLIENNLKRIKLLEEMAQITYKEWFVRLRFPGHETTPINPETGLPEEWKKVKLGDVLEFIKRGVVPKYVEEGGTTVINQKCVRDRRVNLSLARQTSKDNKIPTDKFVKNTDILVNSTGTGTLGRVSQYFGPNEFCTVDTHVTIVRGNTSVISPYVLGRFLEHVEPFIVNLGKGATNQQELSGSDMCVAIKINLPPIELQHTYETTAKPIYEEINNLQKQNIFLQEARDILLPRLMTGMIDVEQYNPADL